jgi:hypothetical protein
LARITSDSQESILKPSALEILFKLSGDVCGQIFTMTGQLGLKLGPVFLNDLIE